MGLFDKLKQTVEDVPRAVPAASEQTTEVVFPKLPDTLEVFKALPQAQLSTPSDTAALTVLALCFYPENAELSLQMLGFLQYRLRLGYERNVSVRRLLLRIRHFARNDLIRHITDHPERP